MSSSPAVPVAARLERTRLALIQLGQTSPDKSFNLSHAREAVLRAAREGPDGGADVVVLPECFNSPYGVDSFAPYAESLEGLWEKVKAPISTGAGAGAGGGTTSAKAPAGAPKLDVEQKEKRWSIDGLGGRGVDVSGTKSESVKMLSEVAKEAGVVLVGGEWYCPSYLGKVECARADDTSS